MSHVCLYQATWQNDSIKSSLCESTPSTTILLFHHALYTLLRNNNKHDPALVSGLPVYSWIIDIVISPCGVRGAAFVWVSPSCRIRVGRWCFHINPKVSYIFNLSPSQGHPHKLGPILSKYFQNPLNYWCVPKVLHINGAYPIIAFPKLALNHCRAVYFVEDWWPKVTN